MGSGQDPSSELGGQSLQLQATGLTLLGVLLGIATTVAFGIGGAWWVRLLAGATVLVVLLLVVRVAARPGHGAMAKLGHWITRG